MFQTRSHPGDPSKRLTMSKYSAEGPSSSSLSQCYERCDMVEQFSCRTLLQMKSDDLHRFSQYARVFASELY